MKKYLNLLFKIREKLLQNPLLGLGEEGLGCVVNSQPPILVMNKRGNDDKNMPWEIGLS